MRLAAMDLIWPMIAPTRHIGRGDPPGRPYVVRRGPLRPQRVAPTYVARRRRGWRGWSRSSAHRDGLAAMLRFSDVSHRMMCSSSLRPGTGAAGVPRDAFGRRFQRAGGSSRVNHPQAQMCLVTVKVAVEME